MHVKTVSPCGWDFDRPAVMPIKVSSRGLIGNDRTEFLKTASVALANKIDNIKIAKDEEPVHIIALGAYEAYGPNRNGDAFDERNCRDHHDTFTKHARYYRNHKNKPHLGHPHYGIVKASAYNEQMKWVELLALLNAQKSATDRNGGLIADRELEKLARGENIPTSMACMVHHDVCGWCGKQSRNPSEYCTKESCAAGGCRDNLAKLVKVGNIIHHVHVKNPNPRWFDISSVSHNADRISFAGSADWMKSAEDNGGFLGVGGFETATRLGLEPPTRFTKVASTHDRRRLEEQLKVATLVARVEDLRTELPNVLVNSVFIMGRQPVEYLPDENIKRAEAYSELARRGVVLSPYAFLCLECGSPAMEPYMKEKLAGLTRRMLLDGGMEDILANAAFDTVESSYATKLWARKYADHKITGDLTHLVQKAAMVSANESFYSADVDQDVVEEYARNYCAYKVAALHEIWRTQPDDFLLTVRVAVEQNRAA